MMKIVLIGFMGVGKSTVAKALSRLLGLALVEMDDLVYQKTNTKNMHEVFAKGGELLLRETEIVIAKEYATKENVVISAGGGVVHNKIILDYFRNGGAKIIFLKAAFDDILKRLEKGTRPLFEETATAKNLYDFRSPLYVNYADETVDVGSRSAEEVALEIKEIINRKVC